MAVHEFKWPTQLFTIVPVWWNFNIIFERLSIDWTDAMIHESIITEPCGVNPHENSKGSINYSQACIKRSRLGQRNRTRKRWPLKTGDCLIEVAAWKGLAVLLHLIEKFKLNAAYHMPLLNMRLIIYAISEVLLYLALKDNCKGNVRILKR